MKSENDALKRENAELKKRLDAVYAAPSISENDELLQAKISALEEEIGECGIVDILTASDRRFTRHDLPDELLLVFDQLPTVGIK